MLFVGVVLVSSLQQNLGEKRWNFLNFKLLQTSSSFISFIIVHAKRSLTYMFVSSSCEHVQERRPF
jgi:hypothetical protein